MTVRRSGAGISRLRAFRRRPRTDPALPTINIVFLLLLFFLLAGTLTAPGESERTSSRPRPQRVSAATRGPAAGMGAKTAPAIF